MKKFITIAILGTFCLVALFSATPTWADGKKFAYMTPSLTLPFWRYLAKGIEDKVLAAGDELTVYDSNNNASTQLANAQDAIARKVDGILISPTDSSTCPKVLSLAEKAGIPVIIADIGTDSGDYVSFIISDNYDGAYAVGKMLGAEFKKRGWEGAEYAQVTISLARANGRKRTEGFRKAMQEAGAKEVDLKQMETYTGDETFRYVQDMLTAHPNLKGIFVETDQPSMGAVRAVRAARKTGEVLIAGFDGIPEFVKMIQDGQIIGSGMQQPHLMGQRCIEVLYDYLAGKKIEKEVLVPIIVVDTNNINDVLPTIKKSVFADELK